MKHSARDNAEGKMHQVKGGIKEVVGKAINDEDLIVDGKVEQVQGKVQGKVGQIKKAAGK